MYTIIMNKDKQLISTVRTTLYQREKMVDKIQFLFPQKYEDVDLNELTAVIKYIDIGNVLHSETLAKDNELYKDKIRCILPVDSKLNRFAGNVVVRVIFTKTNVETGETTEVLKTGECVLSILGDNSIIYADEEMAEKFAALENQIASMSSVQVDGLVYDSESSTLRLTAGGITIGEKVSVDTMINEGTPVINLNAEEPIPSTDTDVVNF